MSQKCVLAAKKANNILDCIGESMSNRSSKVILPLYLAFLRSHLECCVQFEGSSVQKRPGCTGMTQSRSHQSGWGMKYGICEEKLGDLNHRMVWDGRDLKDHLVPTPMVSATLPSPPLLSLPLFPFLQLDEHFLRTFPSN